MEIFPIAEVRTRLESHDGGWEVVHESPNLEVGVLVRIAPTPDPPVRHAADEVYVVLAGEATLEAEGESRRLKPGDTAFVPSARSTTSSTTNAFPSSSYSRDAAEDRWLKPRAAEPRQNRTDLQ